MVTAQRPRCYHRVSGRSPYLDALGHLCSLRTWTDERMADALTVLDAPALVALERCAWDKDAIDGVLDDARERALWSPAQRLPWTVPQVRYYRRVYLRRKRRRPSPSELAALRRERSRLYQTEYGWGHLLPAYDEAGSWQPGLELPPRAVQLLRLLWEYGPLRRSEILRALRCWGSLPLTCSRRYLLRWLVSLGLIVRDGLRRFTLAPEATRQRVAAS